MAKRRAECTGQENISNADAGTQTPTVQSAAVYVTQLSKVACKI
jgi:hypothetical protein